MPIRYQLKTRADILGIIVAGSVAQCGTEPAKFAFKDAFVTFSRISNLDQLVADASRYPVEKKKENIEKFHAQLEAWKRAHRRHMIPL